MLLCGKPPEIQNSLRILLFILVAFLDIDAKKIGGTLRGLPVYAADDLPKLFHAERHPIVLVAVSSHGARPLIRARLDDWGLVETEDYWCVA